MGYVTFVEGLGPYFRRCVSIAPRLGLYTRCTCGLVVVYFQRISPSRIRRAGWGHAAHSASYPTKVLSELNQPCLSARGILAPSAFTYGKPSKDGLKLPNDKHRRSSATRRNTEGEGARRARFVESGNPDQPSTFKGVSTLVRRFRDALRYIPDVPGAFATGSESTPPLRADDAELGRVASPPLPVCASIYTFVTMYAFRSNLLVGDLSPNSTGRCNQIEIEKHT